MKRKTKKQLSVILMIIGLSIMSISLISLSYLYIKYEIIIPAKHSVTLRCTPEEAINQNITAAAKTLKLSNGTTIITFYVTPDKEILKHEYCHVNQYNRKYWLDFSCKYQNKLLVSEMECYLSEDIPDFLYKKIYGDYEKTLKN